MRLIVNSEASAATAPSRLLGMTCMASIDGTIPVLAAQGALGNPFGAVAIGLTIVAGIGAWIAAWQAFPGRLARRAWPKLAGYAAISMIVTVAAAALGAALGDHLVVLPKLAGLVVMLIALQVGGLKLPTVRGIPLTAISVLAGVALEVYLWIP